MAKDTEQIILTAARQQFLQKGYAAARMQEIADEAGINKAMLHYYFRSKDKLFEQIIVESMDLLLPSFISVLTAEGSVLEKVEKIVHTYISTLIEHPEIPFFVMSELAQKRESFIEVAKKRLTAFPAIPAFLMQMQEEMDAGIIKEVPPLHLLLNIMSMSVFPFMAKPIFCNVLELPEEHFAQLMNDRAAIVTDFIKRALQV